MSNPRRMVAQCYSSDAEAYEKTWAPVLRPHARQLLDCLPLHLAGRVLDAGAGVGSLLPDIRKRAPSAVVVAADCALGMLARAPASVPRTVTDLLCLGFAPATFDVVVMAFVLFHVHDPSQAMREARRVLRPAGTVGAITWDGEPRFPAQRVWMEELDSQGAVAIDPSFVNYEPVGSPTKMRGLLEAAGFDAVRAWTAPFDHEYGMEEFITIRTTRGIHRRRFESLDEDRRRSFLHRVRERLGTMQRSDFVDRSTLIFTTATRR